MSTTARNVCWAQLYNKEKQKLEGDPFKIKPTPDDVADLKDIVIDKMNLKELVREVHLIKVYKSGIKSFSEDKAFAPDKSVQVNTTAKDPIIVMVPRLQYISYDFVKQQPKDKMTGVMNYNDTSSLLASPSSDTTMSLSRDTTGTTEPEDEGEFQEFLNSLKKDVACELDVLDSYGSRVAVGNSSSCSFQPMRGSTMMTGGSNFIEEFQIDKDGFYGIELFEDKKIYRILAPIYEYADKNGTREYKKWLIPSRKSIRSAIETLHRHSFGKSGDDKYISNTINNCKRHTRFDHEYIINLIEEVKKPDIPRTILDVDSILGRQIVKCFNHSRCKSIIGLEVKRSTKVALCDKCKCNETSVSSKKRRIGNNDDTNHNDCNYKNDGDGSGGKDDDDGNSNHNQNYKDKNHNCYSHSNQHDDKDNDDDDDYNLIIPTRIALCDGYNLACDNLSPLSKSPSLISDRFNSDDEDLILSTSIFCSAQNQGGITMDDKNDNDKNNVENNNIVINNNKKTFSFVNFIKRKMFSFLSFGTNNNLLDKSAIITPAQIDTSTRGRKKKNLPRILKRLYSYPVGRREYKGDENLVLAHNVTNTSTITMERRNAKLNRSKFYR